MGIMGFLRNRMGLIVIILIGAALSLFIIMDVVEHASGLFRDDNTTIGEVGGETITYDDFNKKVEANEDMFKQQSHQATLPPQYVSYVQETTWNQILGENILNHEMDKLGLVVSDDERKDIIQGNDLNPQIVQAFQGPDGKVDRAKYNEFLARVSSAKTDDPTAVRWNSFVQEMVENKRNEKYLSLVSNGLYINSLDVKDDYDAKNKLVNLQYVKLDYSSIPDNKVNPTDEDYQNYYNDHKSEFKNNEELRSAEFVSFNAAPSKDDSAVVKAQIEKLIPDFKASKDDSSYVALNAETKTPLLWQHKGQLDPKMLDSIMFNEAPGFVYGPYLSAGSYKVAKLVAAETGPDSVKARHILLPVTTSLDKTLKTADSIKQIIQSGKSSFADMAKMYSVDKGSAEKGGELGTFGRGAMVPVFEDAAFNGKKGDLKVVTSQYGVHLIEIEDQKGSQKVVKVAVVDKPIAASSATQSAAYSKAQAFLGAVNGDFEGEAKKENLKVLAAPDFNAISNTFGSLGNARDVVKWAYKASAGDVSDQVFTVGDQYIVARVTQVKPKGILPLEDVKAQIKQSVIQGVKGKLLSDKLQEAENGASSINQVAQKVGTTVVPLQNIVFANPIIPAAGPEFKVLGAVFGSQPGKLSKPVQGTAGVYVFTVDGFVKPAPLTNEVRQKDQMGQMLSQRSEQMIFEALKDKANVKDYRSKFL
jgi:peptidyl-prolyl cis-trans isomerase D